MSKSKPVLRAVIVPSEGRVLLCGGCYFDGHGESVIFKEVAREPVCNSA